MANKLTILDYGMSNLRSVAKACERLGARVTVDNSGAALESCDLAILPGVGAFGHAMAELASRNLIAPLKAYAQSGRPLLGICLGLQLFLTESEEAPGVEGLNLIEGKVIRFPKNTGFKVPHMGWNQLSYPNKSILFDGIADQAFVYFVHSYHGCPLEAKTVVASSEYGLEFAAALQKGNLYATQFHPEKSQGIGMKILENFIQLGDAA